MGMLQERALYEPDPQTRVEVETRNNFFFIEYALIINGRKQDQITGFLGHYLLRGCLPSEQCDTPCLVHIRQSMFTTRYTLEFKGQTIPLPRVK